MYSENGVFMKKYFLFFVLIFVSVSLFAGPFGLEEGMSLEEITAQCVEKPEFFEDDMFVIYPKKKHPLFSIYVVCVNEKYGLYEIVAADIVSCDKQGSQARNKFNNIVMSMSEKYKSPEIYDTINPDVKEKFQSEEYWLETFSKRLRVLGAIWRNSDFPDNLEEIDLFCRPSEAETDVQIVLYYNFKNKQKVKNEINSYL